MLSRFANFLITLKLPRYFEIPKGLIDNSNLLLKLNFVRFEALSLRLIVSSVPLIIVGMARQHLNYKSDLEFPSLKC